MTRQFGNVGNYSAGFTLVELLAASAILVLGLLVAFGAIVTIQRSVKAAQVQGDQTAEMRTAMNQLGEDLGFTQWCANCSQACTFTGQTVESNLVMTAYQAQLTQQAQPANGVPGYIPGVTVIGVRYVLSNDRLMREVIDDPKATQPKVISSQLIAADLLPCVTANADPSHLTNTTASGLWSDESNRKATVILQRRLTGTGGNNLGPLAAFKSMWSVR